MTINTKSVIDIRAYCYTFSIPSAVNLQQVYIYFEYRHICIFVCQFNKKVHAHCMKQIKNTHLPPNTDTTTASNNTHIAFILMDYNKYATYSEYMFSVFWYPCIISQYMYMTYIFIWMRVTIWWLGVYVRDTLAKYPSSIMWCSATKAVRL
jgi:hypothetical protein